MESAFIKVLKHVLFKKFNYVIVADKGFGSDRFKIERWFQDLKS